MSTGKPAAVPGAAFQFFGEGQRVQRINLVKQAEGAHGLIALQVADQMPSRVQVREERGLGFPLLRAAFAEVAHACGKGLLDALDGMVLETATRVTSSGRRPARRRPARSVRGPRHIRQRWCSGGSAMERDSNRVGGSMAGCGGPGRLTARLTGMTWPRAEHSSPSKGSTVPANTRKPNCSAGRSRPEAFPMFPSAFRATALRSGKLIASFLNGEFGKLEAVDAHLSALLYAGDRFEAKPELEAALAAGKTILTDRYVASNLAHQTARVPPERRTEFMVWLRQLEYGIYGLPVEDLVIYLRLGAAEAQQLVGQKAPREYTALGHDLQESDLTHLERAAQVYDRLATESNWVTIECFDARGGKHEIRGGNPQGGPRGGGFGFASGGLLSG